MTVRGDLGFQLSSESPARYFDAAQGGGALLDIGCYAIQYITYDIQSRFSQSTSMLGYLRLAIPHRMPDELKVQVELSRQVDMVTNFLFQVISQHILEIPNLNCSGVDPPVNLIRTLSCHSTSTEMAYVRSRYMAPRA